jgi:L-fucose isomerase-like protein
MTGLAEHELRTQDIGRPEPAAAVLDRLARAGHERNGFCGRCWSVAGDRAISQPARPQAHHYLDVLAEAEYQEELP